MKWLLLVSLLCDPCSSADHNIQWIATYTNALECKQDAPKAVAKLQEANKAAYAAVKQSAPAYPMMYTCAQFSVTKP